MIWTVPKTWTGETAFLLAGGPSLIGFDAAVLKGKGRIITINDSWRLAPSADVLYFCDESWWTYQINRNSWPKNQVNFHELIYKGFWVTCSQQFCAHPQVHALKFTGQTGLEKDPAALKHGSNSGYQAIGLAYHFGVSRIVLLGYDMQCQGTRTHWHEEPRIAAPGFSTVLSKSMLPLFDYLAAPLKEAGVEVINATPGSALKCWLYVPLEEILKEKTEWQLTPQ